MAASGNLYLLGVEEGDAGVYRCVATNPVTGAKRRTEEVTLTVLGECGVSVG